MKKPAGTPPAEVPIKKNLGPLEKAPKKRWRLDPNHKILFAQIAIGVGIFTLLGLILAGVWWITRLPSLTITSVTASGGETIPADEVKDTANAVLNGMYGRIIPKRFFAFYPQAELLREVGKVDRIKDVLIERMGQNELRITYGEYTPYALWCEAEPSDKCLFLDERGYAFAPAPQLKGGSFIRYRNSAQAPEIGKAITSFDDFWKTISLAKLLAADEQFVRSIDVDAVGDLYYGLVSGGELRVSLQQKPEEVFSNLQTILQSGEFKHLKKENYDYIDLRFGNKVYINEKGSMATSTVTSTDGIGERSSEGVSSSTPLMIDFGTTTQR